MPPQDRPTEDTPPIAQPSRAMAYVLMALVCLVWGSTWLVIKVGLADLPPLTSAGVRIFSAGLVMSALAPWLVRLEGGRPPPMIATIAHGTSQFGLNYALVYHAESVLPSGVVSVLWSVFPLLIALGGELLGERERLGWVRWGGSGVAFAGVVALFFTDIRQVGPSGLGAASLLLLAPVCVAASTLLVKRRAMSASSVLLNRDGMLLGGSGLLVGAYFFEGQAPWHWTPLGVGSVVYLTLMGTVFTFGVYMWLLRHLPAYLLSLSSYVTPVIALLLGVAVGGEPLRATTVVGAVLVLLGVAMTLRRRAPA